MSSGPATATPAAGGGGEQDLDNIWDEELLRNMWQTAEDFGERRRIRARMYRLRELRLREMVQNDEESLGTLTTAEGEEDMDDDDDELQTLETSLQTSDTSATSTRRLSTIEVQLSSSEGQAGGDSQAIDSRIKKAGQERSTRYQLIKDKLNTESDSDALVSVTKQGYSLQNNALASDGYSSIKNKETRDSLSPTRYRSGNQATEDELDSEEALALLAETESVVKALQKAGKTVKVIKSEIPVRRDPKTRPQVRTPSPKKGSPTRSSKIASKMDASLTEEFGRLHSYLKSDSDDKRQVLVNEEEEEMTDEYGNKVQMFVTTTKDKDGKEFTTRRTARTTKVVENESDIDEILIGNPDHEVLERDVTEEVGADGSKIKVITETRRRPDGIEYTTKNVLKTSKIFDYDHPEDVSYCDSDELLSTSEKEETDECGATIRIVTETRRKCDGTEYTTKKVYKTSKCSSRITPSDDDEVINTKETEEKDKDGNITRIVIESRRTATGEEYTHRQVFKCRRMTLTGVELQEGMPMMDNDDQVLNKKEKKERDENGAEITVVTETRRRKDGTKYTFDYILRSFTGSAAQVKSMPVKSAGATNIKVSDEDELLKEEVKEEVQKDGSTLKTIIERRRAMDGTEYLRHRIMRIPKIPELQLTVGTANDEVLENDVEEMEYNGTRIKSVTERRRSSLTGLQYTLRRMSKTYQQTRRPSTVPGDEVLDENVIEEEGDDGTIIKSVIRRYQRRDGTIYTTHNINKSFTAPTHVVIEDDDSELIDQTMDQKETEDGYIIKTVFETYQRSDGVQYTIERTEKTDKNSASVMYTNDYPNQPVELIVPSNDDVVLSQDVEEQPDDEGHVVKVIVEERQRSNGTKYTTKTTMTIAATLVPEQETSYVVIKPDAGMDDTELLPSMNDELVYTRKREETDHEGNPITVVIETRKSKTTGEMYNITKRVFTTDVLVTDKGERIIKRSTQAPRGSAPKSTVDKLAPTGTVSSMKNRLASRDKKDQPKEKEKPRLIRVNTADRRKLFENVADKPNARTTKTSDVLPKDKPSLTAKVRIGKRDATVEEVNARNIQLDNRYKSNERPSSRTSKPDEPKREQNPKKKPEEKKIAPSRRSPTEASPAQTPSKKAATPTRPSPKESPEQSNKAPTRRARSPVTRPSPKPSRDTSPIAGRTCCNRTHGSRQTSPTPSSPTKRPVPTKTIPKEKDTPKLNGDQSSTRRSPPGSRTRPSEFIDSPRRAAPGRTPSEKNLKVPKEPIVSLPQTPMTEDVKSYPDSPIREDEPKIEDVSQDPDLPQHQIHRPSIVREPSEYLGADIVLKVPSDSEEDAPSKSRKNSQPKDSDSDDNKKKPKAYTRKNSTNILGGKVSPQPESPRRGTGTVTDRYRRFDKDDEVKSRKISLENRDSVSLKRSIFEREDKKEPKEPLISSRNRPASQAPTPKTAPTYENREPVEEAIIVPKYFHPLGDEKENEKPKRPSLDSPCDMTSPKLIMRLTSQDQNKPKDDSPSRKSSRPDDSPKRRPSREISEEPESRRPLSKEGSPAPFSKEGSPFSKEGSPSRFVTGRPIDQGVNTNKIKKLERSLSGKVTYDDLEGTRNQLPTYLETIECITDITVLQTMLEEAKTYEERRVIRGQIRVAKKGAPAQPTPSSNTSHRFTTPSRRQESPDTKAPTTRPSEARPSDRSPTRTTRHRPYESDTKAAPTASRPTERDSPDRDEPTRSKQGPYDSAMKTEPTAFRPKERNSPGRDSPSKSSSPDRSRPTRPSSKDSPTRDRPSSLNRRTTRTEPVAATDPSSPTSSQPPSPRKTSDPTALVPASSQRKPSREEASPSRSSNPDASRDRKEPEQSDDDLPAKQPTDRLTNGTSRRLTSRRTSDDDTKLSKTEKTTQLTRKNTRESTVTTKTTEVSDTEEVKETKTTSRSLFSRRASEDKKLTRRDTSDKKSVMSRKDSGDKKTLFARKDSGEPRTPSSRTKAPEKTSTPSSRTPYIKQADRPSQKQPGKASVPESSDIYSEPLRHQGAPRRMPGNTQTDVEKIVSPYGVGVTDENGLPLFGLRALKRRNQQPTAEPTPAPDVEKPKEFEPTDASGRPLFGLKALATTTTDTRETASTSVTTETSVRKSSVTKTQRKKSRNEDYENRGGSSSSSPSSASSSPAHSDNEEGEEYPDDVDSVIHASTRRTQTSAQEEEEEVIQRRSQPLKDIIKLHEKIVREPTQPADETPRSKPKKVLRSNFEPSPEANEPKQAHKTWDVESDLQTRALDMKNIISRHESISKEPEDVEPKAPKKLTGILKKTSTTSVTEAQYAASSISATTVDTSDFMESMTDDQIAKLSEEFDRRAQDDGIINGDVRTSRGTTPSRSDTSPDRDRVRKTSYTEIKLSQPSQEGNSQSQQSSSSSSFSVSRSTDGCNGYTSSSRSQTASYCNGGGGVDLRDGGKSFLQDRSKVSGFADVMGRMAATDAVEGSAQSDDQARSLLNRFLGAQVLLTGVESMMANSNGGGHMTVTETRSSSSATDTKRSQAASTKSGDPVELVKGVDINSEQDEDTLRKLLDSCDAYEDRRKVRQRLKNLAASAKGGVSESGVAASQGASKRGSASDSQRGSSSSSALRSTQDVATVNSWLAENFPDHQTNGLTGPRSDSRTNSQASTYSSSYSTQSSKVTKVSPFNKFQQLDAQQPTTRRASGGGAAAGGGPLFALSTSLKTSANSIKDVLLCWCQCRTRDYKGIKIENFSTSWNDGMAFCALIHHFYPDAFDFDKLDPKNRRYNFDLAFRTADERAGVMALLDVEDMVMMKKPDWKCVFTYIQSLYKRLKDE